MVDLFVRVVNMSVTASVIAALLTLLRLVLKRHLPPTFCYLLWGTVLFRLLVPISVPAIFSLFNLVRHRLAPAPAQSYMVTLDYVESGYVPVQSSDTQTLFLVLTAVWLTVAALLLVYTIAINLHIGGKAQTAFLLREQDDILEQCKALTHTTQPVGLYHSTDFETPVVVGVLRPKIILPSSMDLQNRSMLVHIITHELIHIRRHDMVTKKLAALALIIHWFNPLVWLCCIQLDRDLEISCDEEALSRLGAQSRTGYAQSLVELCARSRRFWRMSALSFGETAIKTRVVSAINYRRLSKPKTVALYALVVAVGVVTSTNPVAVSNGYLPTRHSISTTAQTAFEDATLILCDILARGDVAALLELSGHRDAYYRSLYDELAQNPLMVERYKLYPQSEQLAYCYLRLDEERGYTACLEREGGGVRLTRLTPTPTFEAAMAVEESEPVRFVRNLHRFGITTGFSQAEGIPKPRIAALCIDEEYRDRLKRGEISSDTVYLPPEWIEQAAADYFGLRDFSYTFDEALYDSDREQYIYADDRGERTEAQVIAQRSENGAELVTAQFYRDPLHLIAEQTITYTLQKRISF